MKLNNTRIMKKRIIMILALDEKNWLWKWGDLPWRIKKDMKFFKQITTTSSSEIFPDFWDNNIWNKKNAVIMWRKTWDSIPEKYKPLPNRVNLILSRSYVPEQNTWDMCQYNSIDSAIHSLQNRDDIADIYILWWAQIYNQILDSRLADSIFLTRVSGDYDCDVFVDNFDNNFELMKTTDIFHEWNTTFRFEMYEKRQ